MKLSQLINLEVQFLRDEQARTSQELDAIRRRDRAIGHHVAQAVGLDEETADRELAANRPQRHAACAAWLAQLPRQAREALPGERIEAGYQVAGWMLFGMFFLAGIGAASAALASPGGQPVNVLVFVVVFFVLQIGLLLLYPVLALIRRVRGGELLPLLQGLLSRLSQLRFVGKLTGRSEHDPDLEETFGQLRARQTLYAGVQQWMLFTLVQRMAFGFNLAALLASLYMVTFHDLAFCWSTTLDIQASQLSHWLSWIAAPWSWLGEYAAPGLQAIEVSRYVPAEGGYLSLPAGLEGAEAAQLRRTWWPFLVAGLVTWGLLPRALAFGVGALQSRRTSRALPLKHMAVQHLFERLFPPPTDWSGPSPDEVRGEQPTAADEVQPRALARTTAGSCHLVCWGSLFEDQDAVRGHVERRFGNAVVNTHGAGLADPGADQRSLATLNSAEASRVVVTLPEGQQPTKDLMRFLKDLRSCKGADLELVVGLLTKTGASFGDVDASEIQAWRERLLAEADPFLSLQTMAVPGETTATPGHEGEA